MGKKRKESKTTKMEKQQQELEFKIYYINSGDYFNMNKVERIKKIVELLKNKNIVIIDSVIPPNDELEIIKDVINNVNHVFKGIEISTIKKEEEGFFNRLFSKKTKGLTIIGPSNLVKKLEKESENLIRVKL